MTLHILNAGLATRLVDGGRPAYRSLGMSTGGPADRASWQLGNALIGNTSSLPALEISLAGPVVKSDDDLACVLFGASFNISLRGRSIRSNVTFTLPAREELHIEEATNGARAYLCVRGGFSPNYDQARMILGSLDSLDFVRAGDEFKCRPGSTGGRFIHVPLELRSAGPAVTLRVIDGPQSEWFDSRPFYEDEFAVSTAADRMGIRLSGPRFKGSEKELESEAVAPGAVQVTRDGQCIIMGVDAQTIGGYPKLAHVIQADLDLVGQIRPGTRIRFRRMGLKEARESFAQRQRLLRKMCMTIQAGATIITKA